MENKKMCGGKPVRLGVIGMGQRTVYHGWVNEISDSVNRSDFLQVAALCDNRKERLDRAAGKFREELGITAAVYTDYEEMLNKEKLDAVYIASPNYLHREMAVASFKAGCDVLCEKPMATTLSDADVMIQASKQYGKLLGLGMQMRYRRRYHKVAEIINEGRIGNPVMVWCTEYRGPYAEIKDWVWEKEKSGGAIVEKNCHHVDIMDMFSAGGYPDTVYAVGGQKKYSEIYGQKSEIVDHAWITWNYDNGVKGMIGVSFVNTSHYREFGVIGTEGRIIFNSTDGEIIHVYMNNNDTEDIEAPGVLCGGLFNDFIDCVKSRKTPFVTAELGRRSLLVPLAAEKSIEEKRPIAVRELEKEE